MPAEETKIEGGTIQSVDQNAKTLTIQSNGSELDVSVDENTTITVNRHYRQFSELASGQKVRKLYYAGQNGKILLTVIHVIDEKKLEEEKRKKKEEKTEERKPVI